MEESEVISQASSGGAHSLRTVQPHDYGRVITTEMVRKAEEEMNIGDA